MDNKEQAEWLSAQAQQLGYESVQVLLSQSPEIFFDLAERWRNERNREQQVCPYHSQVPQGRYPHASA